MNVDIDTAHQLSTKVVGCACYAGDEIAWKVKEMIRGRICFKMRDVQMWSLNPMLQWVCVWLRTMNKKMVIGPIDATNR